MSTQLQQLASQIEQIILLLGYTGIVILMFADQWILPLPAALILGFAGFATVDSTTRLSFGLVVIASTLGSVLGALSIFALVQQVNREQIFGWASAYGVWVGMTERRLSLGLEWFERSAPHLMVLARFVPAMRTLISWPAGMSQVSTGRFAWTTVLGCAIFNTAMLYGGRQLKANWRMILIYVQQYEQAVGLIFGSMVLIWVARWGYARHRQVRQTGNKGG